MAGDDFFTWYSAGAYGGLVCALVTAAVIAMIALRGRRGAPRQVAAAVLACLAGAVLTLPAVWWDLNRLEVYGPLLAGDEVTLWLAWTAAFGWLVPLAALAGFWSFAGAPAATVAGASGSPVPRISDVPLASLADPARQVEPRGPGRAWGRLVAVDGPYAGRSFPLTRQLTLLGRQADNDIVLDGEQSSRYHAEIRWDHGHVQLVDRLSTNGTLLNRQLVRGLMPLQAGDVIEVGGQRYRFEPLDGAQGVGAIIPPPIATEKMRGVPTVSRLFEGDPLVLIALNGPVTGSRWLLHAGVITIGRDAECDVNLQHPSVSRRHAQIVRQQAGYFVQDVESINGTLLNGQQLAAPAVLSPGDVLRIGEIELRCVSVGALGTPPPPPPSRPRARSAVTTPPAGILPPGVFSNSGAPVARTHARLGPPRLTPSDPPAREGPHQQ